RCRVRASVARLPAGGVEVVPVLAFADHGLQVLAPHHAVGDGVLHDRAADAGGDVGGAQHAVAEVRGQGDAVGDDGDGLGGAEGAAGGLDLGAAVLGDAVAQFPEDGDDAADLGEGGGHLGQVEVAAQLGDAAGDDLDLVVGGLRDRQHDGVEAAAQRAGQVVDAAVAVVGGGDDVEAALGLHLDAEFGHRQGLLRQDGDQRVLHVGGDAGEFLDAGQAALGHGGHDGAGHQGLLGGPLGEQAGVVPAVAHRFLGGARGALDQQGGVAGDGGGEVFGQPGLGGAGHAEQQQGAVGGQGGDGDLDDAARAHVLGGDLGAVVEGGAEDVLGDGPRRQLPAGRAGAVVGLGEGGGCLGVGLVGGGAQRGGGGGQGQVSPLRMA